MSESIELEKLERAQEGAGEPLDNNNCGEERGHGAKAQANVDGLCPPVTPEEEIESLLPAQGAASNGSQHTAESHVMISVDPQTVHAQESRRQRSRKNKEIQWITASLNEIVFWKLKLWMIIVIIFLVIALVIILSLVLCSVIYEDEDEKFDRDLFTVPIFYSGTFKLVNQEFTEELLSTLSPQSQNLSAQLREKLSDLYSSSPALGRYFFGAGVSLFRYDPHKSAHLNTWTLRTHNVSIMAHYWLKFQLPSEHVDLLQYTVSKEMVLNVLRQHLYDKDTDLQDSLYIDPTSLHMDAGRSILTEK
ncbi:TPA-induced transmembrane protein homolog isoform X1 [Scleropages formosus]|uniref:TPA-induced transmembrane protein homolog isoform X1 n=1 Tax=Scleropages formosus TaxID=113540 RepID=UPI000877FFD9|nr:TPA-induced transmembrane protein isoform X1 [Scleropages formosus]